MNIRPARPEDTPAMARVRVDTWKHSYRGVVPDEILAHLSYEDVEQRWYKSLWDEGMQGVSFVAEDTAGKIVGIAITGPIRKEIGEEYKGEIYVLYVLPGSQRQGTGRKLVRACALWLDQAGLTPIMLWTFAQGPARSFYESLGGTVIGDQELAFGEKTIKEVAYGWREINSLVNSRDD